jgi:hypothetical protein
MKDLTVEAVLDALKGAPSEHPSVFVSGNIVSLAYFDDTHYAARTSNDVEALRTMPGFDLVSSSCEERAAPGRSVIVTLSPAAVAAKSTTTTTPKNGK